MHSNLGSVRLYRIIMRSGANVDVLAKMMIDEPDASEIFFYQDESGHHLAAAIRRDQVAGMIFGPQKSSAIPTH